MKRILWVFAFVVSYIHADIILGPGESVQVGNETIACRAEEISNANSVVDQSCVQYMLDANHDAIPDYELLLEWIDSCRSVPITHPLTPKTCTVVGGKINVSCNDFIRKVYPSSNSTIVLKTQLACKDLELSCSSFN